MEDLGDWRICFARNSCFFVASPSCLKSGGFLYVYDIYIYTCIYIFVYVTYIVIDIYIYVLVLEVFQRLNSASFELRW